jgi:protocatechuate 3,4-dioxygenase beta subunit
MRKKIAGDLSRREALEALGVVGVALTVGCGGDSVTGASATGEASSAATTGTTAGSSTCAVTPEETAGPYPSNSVLNRRDITEGKSGLPLALTITVVNAGNNCNPVANAAVEIWHCDAQGNYSEYSQPGFDGRGQTFLRGVQTTDSSGQVTFTTIYPGWYSGRATHIHLEVLVNGRSVKTSQIAFPEDVTAAVYGTGVYAAKGQNPTRNAGDNVFSDGVTSQTATLSGNTTSGYSGTFTVGVSV